MANNDTVRLGIIGLGQRGAGMLRDNILKMEDVQVTALCDTYEDRRENCADAVEQQCGKRPFVTADYAELLRREDIDAVYIATSWDQHVPMCVAAMRAGVTVGCEVGGGLSVEDCYTLVRVYEETKTPLMFMENCCYGRNELMMLNMKEQGVLGEIIHCDGGYCHDLRDEVAFGRENRHYRLENYLHRNGENYPTHELGPIARLLDIGNGNRMVSLYSMASKSRGLNTFLMEKKGPDYDLTNATFAQGDVVTTLIKCERGETIRLTLDTTLPRGYSRQLGVHGTKGSYQEDNQSVFLDGVHNKYDFTWQTQWNNIEELREQYESDIWKDYIADGVRGGHDGIDWLELRAFFTCVKEKKPMPIDVYDMAAWMAITPLSEQSIAENRPVEIPDFTASGK